MSNPNQGNRIMHHRILTLLVIIIALLPIAHSISSVPPTWISSNYFKAGTNTFTYGAGTANQNATIVYSSSIANTTLKVPTLGITDFTYTIAASKIQVLIKVVAYTVTSLIFNVQANVNNYLQTLKLSYLAVDNLFTPAFSMNYYFPYVNQTGPNFTYQTSINFTASTGVTLNTSHENVLLPFMHYIDCNTGDGTIDLELNFTLLNASFYSVVIKSTSGMTVNYAGFSRLIFDKTAIENMGYEFFNYGVVTATNNNNAALSTTIPPDILSNNLFYGMHSFNIQTGLSQMNFNSSFNATSGFIGMTSKGTYVYSQMKFSYFHHKTRVCPATNPYFNVTQLLCYDHCADGWYPDNTTMTCKQCMYECTTCSDGTSCLTCDNTTNHREFINNRCPAVAGYYDDGSHAVALACTSPCATCVTSATNCLSCISGYYLQSATCLLCSAAIPDCVTCNNATFCTLCNDGSNGTTCTVCQSNQYFNANNTCIVCSTVIANCQSCTSNSSCTMCFTTFTMVNATSCSCVSGEYQASGQCYSCGSAISNCESCVSATNCTACAATFTMFSLTNCSCNSTTYLDTNSTQCLNCTLITSNCLSCTSMGCTACISNYTLTASGTCQILTCNISHCDGCLGNSTTICQSCSSGYSVSSGGSSCLNYCGNYALDTSQECDDGNSVSGDGCSSSCKQEAGFSCYKQYVNVTNSYSYCFYTSTISFNKVWIRKYEGNNSLKFQFQLNQQIDQWQTVDFTNILTIDQYDSSSKAAMGSTASIIASYYAEYQPKTNRFWVVVNYLTSMQKMNLVFALYPYAHNVYPAFSAPNSIEFDSPNIQVYTTVTANNNQNANYYTPQEYNLYAISMYVSYGVVGLAMLCLLTSFIFRTGKVIVLEMISLMQLTFFSLGFLDSMSPIYSGMLPLRYLAGILTFQDVESYLEELASPNSMKGIYMYLNLSQNLKWVAFGVVCFISLGLALMLTYFVYDYFANPQRVQNDELPLQSKNGYCFHQLAFHFLGELSLSLIFLYLPIYTISLFFEVFFTVGHLNFWSYAEAFAFGLLILGYFIALIKSDVPKQPSTSRLGEFISEYNCLGFFSIFKYCNLVILQSVIMSGLVMAMIFSNSKVFSALCIVVIAVVDIIVVGIVQPYRYGFVSCCKGEENNTELLFEKIELYKVYENQQAAIISGDQPEVTYKSEFIDNHSELFTQHFQVRKQEIKSRHQGLIQGGEILNRTKLFLFNSNMRRIVNLTTLVLIEFVFICSQVYSNDVSKSYSTIAIQSLIPLLINMVLVLNSIYNSLMIVLQIMDRSRHNPAKVDVEPQSAVTQLNNETFSRHVMERKKDENVEVMSSPVDSQLTHAKDIFQTNQLVIKTNSSIYDLKRPQMLKSEGKIRKYRVSAMSEKTEE